MWRFGADNTRYVSFFTHDGHTLGKHYLAPPSSDSLEINESFFIDPCHHKTDFIQMAGDHDLWAVRISGFFPDKASDIVCVDFVTMWLQILFHNISRFFLIPGDSLGICQIFEHCQCFVQFCHMYIPPFLIQAVKCILHMPFTYFSPEQPLYTTV